VIKENNMALRMRFLSSTPRVFRNQHGAVLYGVLMVLLLLTIIGIASTKVSNTEVQTSTNELIYQQNFYRAEGATMEAAELLEAIPDPSKATTATWLDRVVHSVADSTIRTWSFGGSPAPKSSASLALTDASFIALSEGVAKGSSLDVESSKVHGYAIYGRSAPPNRGATTIGIGYLKAF
jgi:Tfp pilus assembly protein PilX